MIEHGEIIIFLVGLLAFGFIIANRSKLKNLPGIRLLISGFFVLLGSWIFTVVEGILLEDLFNILEHICYTVGSILIGIWCWRIFKKGEKI